METNYGTINELEKLFKKTKNMKMYVDLRNWLYYKDPLDETIEISKSRFLNNH